MSEKVTLIGIFDKYVFSGIPSNAAWDLIKFAYEKLTERSWEDLYLDAFENALRAERPRLRRYSGDDTDEVSLDREALGKVLHHTLAAPLPLMSYGELAEEEFAQSVAEALAANETLIIGGFSGSKSDYAQLVRNIVHRATVLFEDLVLKNESAFQLAVLREAKNNRALLLDVQTFLQQRSGLTLDLLQSQIRVLEGLSTGQKRLEAKQDELKAGQQEIKRGLRRIGGPSPQRHFTTLDKFLSQSKQRFPQKTDFEENLVYYSEPHLTSMMNHLYETNCCLLVGPTAAGKTVLSLALGWQLHHTAGYDIYYLDTRRVREGDGRRWYWAMCLNDRPGVLYILDNCNSLKAEDEVNEFCNFWETEPPEFAQALVVSKPRTDEAETDFEASDFFDLWSDVTVEVQPENLYEGIIKQYADTCHRQNPGRYMAIEDDIAELLERQHAHNLVTSHSRLEVWKERGGRLSDVSPKAVYDDLNAKYLTPYREAMVALCTLWQFEIPIHNRFVRYKLPGTEVNYLKGASLLNSVQTSQYGRVYQLEIHSETAREIFEANLYWEGGEPAFKHVETEIVAELKRYLITQPPNYTNVYYLLYKQQHVAIQHQLLIDAELQKSAMQQFNTTNIAHVAFYLRGLSLIDNSRANDMLDNFIRGAGGLDALRERLLTHNLWDIQLALHRFSKVKVSESFATALAKDIPPATLAAKANDSNLITVSNILNVLKRLAYPSEQLENLVLLLNFGHLVQTKQLPSLQTLFWLTRVLKEISPKQALELYTNIPVEVLAAKASTGAWSSLTKILQYLEELDYPESQLEELVKLIDTQQLAQRAKTQSLQNLFWLTRVLKEISPKQALELYTNIPVQVLAAKASTSSFGPLTMILQYLEELDYPENQLEELVKLIDTQQLAQRAKTQSLQNLFWLTRVLKEISSEQAAKLHTSIPVEVLAAKASTSDFGSLATILRYLEELDYPESQLEELVKLIDTQQLAQRAKTQSLQNLFWLARALGNISHEVSNDLFEEITPAGLAEFCLAEKVTIDQVHQFTKISTRNFRRRFLSKFSTHDIVNVFDRSPLGQVGSFIQHRYRYFEEAFRLFVDLRLRRKLETDTLGEIGKFIHRVGQVSKIEEDLLLAIRNVLKDIDLTDKVANASLRELGYFVWNVYEFTDAELAGTYCAVIDSQTETERLREASVGDLCRLLWHLVQVSNSTALRILQDAVVAEKLYATWAEEIGCGLQLLGILAMTSSEIHDQVVLPEIEMEQKQQLESWLDELIEGDHAYALAQTIVGLLTCNEATALTLVREYLPLEEAEELLSEALAEAIAPRAIRLLQEAREWLAKLMFEATIEEVDRLVANVACLDEGQVQGNADVAQWGEHQLVMSSIDDN